MEEQIYDMAVVPVVATKPVKNNYSVTMSNGFSTTLKRDVDFGMILKKDGTPISQRPTLFASGKDKLLTGLGLVYLTEIVDNQVVIEGDHAFFYYVAKSTAFWNDKPVRTAYGSANSAEKSGGFASPYDLANTAIKKAVKRAEVALAIKLANLSDMFVQDLEDTAIDNQAKQLQKDDDAITAKQVKRIFAIASVNEISVEKAKSLLASWGFTSTKDIKLKDYDMICEKFQNYGKDNT